MPLAAPVTSTAGMPPRLPARALSQTCQSLVPAGPDLGHPVERIHQRRRRDRVARLAALAARLHQAGLLECAEVLGDGLARDRQRAGEPRGGQLRPLGDRAQDLAARRVGKREEDLVYAGHSAAVAAIAISFGPQATASGAKRCWVTTNRVPPGASSSAHSTRESPQVKTIRSSSSTRSTTPSRSSIR